MLNPQANRDPSDLIASVCLNPDDTAVHELDPICTGSDMNVESLLMPFPSRPLPAEPQVNKDPLSVIAEVCISPAETFFY